jgi:uncharacterized protein (TIGR02271 family)
MVITVRAVLFKKLAGLKVAVGYITKSLISSLLPVEAGVKGEIKMQPDYSKIAPGAVVLARDGFIGTVEQVLPAAAGQPGYFVTAPNQNGERLLVPLDLVDANSPSGEVLLKDVFQNVLPRSRSVPAGMDPRAFLAQTAARPVPPVDTGFADRGRLTVPIIEEKLDVGKRTVELGSLEIRKTVEQVQEARRLPLSFDQLDVQHVEVNRPLDAPLEPRYEGDVLIIPVMEEVLVIEKRLMLKEEVRISKRQVVRVQQIDETLRREHVELVPPNNDLVTINDATGTNMAGSSQANIDEILDGDMDPTQTNLPVTEQPTMANPAAPYRPLGYDQPSTPEVTSNRPNPPAGTFRPD